METTFLVDLVRAVWREIIEWRSWVVGMFITLSLGVLAVGLYWPERYETSTMLYADVTNIIEPLLRGRAEVTSIDRSQEAREKIYTRKIMVQAAKTVGLIDSNTTASQQQARVAGLREAIKIENEGKNYFRVSYGSTSQEQSFDMVNAVVDAFISDNAEQRRNESRSAYEFIEQQVVSYKRQLLAAENELKEFKSKNLDGDESSVNARISQLRLQIEELKLTIGEVEARDRSLKEQVTNESAYLNVRGKVDEERSRLSTLKERLDSLRLSYQETYPDIVSLKQQIAAQELVIESMQGGGYVSRASNSDSDKNPLYEELRVRQAETELDLRSQRNRLVSVERMLENEYKRAQRVASKEAEMSELVRDYDVTREIYDEMLGRKEKARLSMTLDVEGQGVSFKIQEPAVYPINPTGLKFIHFVLAAPFVGLLAAIGLVFAYVLLDPRVRSPSLLINSLPAEIELLAVIPHVRTRLTRRVMRMDVIVLALVCLAAAAVYAGIVWSRLNGLL